MNEVLLNVQHLSVAYDSKVVVKKCNFTLNSGEIAVVLGASGDGKTTLLKAIAGLLPQHSGDVFFKEESVKDSNQNLVPGHDLIRLVNQDFDVDLHFSVDENIRVKLLRFNSDYQEQRIASLLRLTRLTTFKSVKADTLSGGQKQRLAIARALADEPELLLMDEPFNQLDFQTKDKISRHVKRYLQTNKIAALMVTHNGVEAMEWADKIIYMEKGRIKRIDTPEAFFNHPKNKREASFFGELNKLKIGADEVFFRPSFFSLTKNATHKLKLKVEIEKTQFLGWYSIYIFKYENQRFRLFSTDNIDSVKEIFIRPIQFND